MLDCTTIQRLVALSFRVRYILVGLYYNSELRLPGYTANEKQFELGIHSTLQVLTEAHIIAAGEAVQNLSGQTY